MMKLYFAMTTKGGMTPEVLMTYRAAGVLDHLHYSTEQHIACARNELVDKFLASEAEYLCWFDDDHLLPKNLGEYLGLAGCAAPMNWCRKQGEVWPGVWRWQDDEFKKPDGKIIRSYTMNELLEARAKSVILEGVSVINGGMWKVPRELIEEVKQDDPHHKCFYDDWEDEFGNYRQGEDIFFFNEMKKRKRTFTVHLGVEIGHYHRCDLLKIGHDKWPRWEAEK